MVETHANLKKILNLIKKTINQINILLLLFIANLILVLNSFQSHGMEIGSNKTYSRGLIKKNIYIVHKYKKSRRRPQIVGGCKVPIN